MDYFHSRTIMYSSVNTMTDDYIEFLNLISQLRNTIVQWNMAERNLSIAEHRSDSALVKRMMELVPRLMENATVTYAPNALVRGEYVIENQKETMTDNFKKSIRLA